MAIMQSCCCWRNVRRGSFACAIYTGVYYSVMTVTMVADLLDEHEYLFGNSTLPLSASILEPDNVSPTTVRFKIVLLICSSISVVCCFLLLYGLIKDRHYFLLPWIATVISCSMIEVAHLTYLFFFSSADFNPTTAVVYTFDFFIFSLNVYSVLCVISQFQEYTAGRGSAAHDTEYRGATVRYSSQPTTTVTSCLSSRRAATNNETRTTAVGTPTQSPTAILSTVTSERSSITSRHPRKHVQFPDVLATNQTEKLSITKIDSSTENSVEVTLNVETKSVNANSSL